MNGIGKMSLPIPHEGKLEPEDKGDSAYESKLKLAQQEVGILQWLAIKSRPDIAAATSIAATLMSKNPTESVRMTNGIWKYLGATWMEGLVLKSSSEGEGSSKWVLDVATDASQSPGGDRSRSGIVIQLNGMIAHCASQ